MKKIIFAVIGLFIAVAPLVGQANDIVIGSRGGEVEGDKDYIISVVKDKDTVVRDGEYTIRDKDYTFIIIKDRDGSTVIRDKDNQMIKILPEGKDKDRDFPVFFQPKDKDGETVIAEIESN